MRLGLILDMVTAAGGDRPVVTHEGRTLTADELAGLARRAAARFAGRPAVLYAGANHLAYPVALFGAALAGVPFVPLNYRLGERQLAALVDRHPGAELIDESARDALVAPAAPGGEGLMAVPGGDDVAAIIYTSGTTAAPKAAVLRHRHLMAYLLNTVEFGSAQPGDAALVSVPPYHIAGLTNLLSSLYSGRRVVYATAFDPADWLATVRRERITHALLVPTMLARIVREPDAAAPTLRNLAYGGARTPRPVLERALDLFPHTGFVNAYGLTETASSVAVLGPDDHREAHVSTDPEVRARLGSVGRPLPGIEIEIRDEDGAVLPAGETGLVHVRGDQISGEYGGRRVELGRDAGGWFATNDLGHVDAAGYLYVAGRADDTIIRGGENIAPAEIEDVLLTHPGVTEAAVVGVPDAEWGQRIVAFVVGDADPDDVRHWVRERLRSSKTPDSVEMRRELPRTETGKLLRRTLLAELEKTDA